MKKSTEQFLSLFFNEGETIGVSPNKFSYYSIDQCDLERPITLISPNSKSKPITIRESDINLVTINPINGFRNDQNVTAYRSFLVEIDDLPLAEQRQYIERLEMPYSICIFSGNKSLHYGIVLDKDLPSEKHWRTICQWILNIASLADQQAKNPSRNIRMPNNRRKNGKRLLQKLVDIRGRISQDELFIWLNKFPDSKPKERVKKKIDSSLYNGKFPKYVYKILDDLRNGARENRNSSWFGVTCAVAERGFSEDEIIDIFDQYFIEDHDFGRREWINTIKSACKRVQHE